MRHLFDFFGFTPEYLSKLEDELYREVSEYLNYKENKEKICEAEKGVSPPEKEKTCCCGEKCKCNEATSGYLAPVNDGLETTCAVSDAATTECSTVVDGWALSQGENGMPVWTREVCVPVEKQYANVAIVDNDTVFVEYDKRVVSEEDGVNGYHSVGGSYSFILPTFADTTTFRAKFVREGILRLSVGETLCREGSYRTVDIEG
jgi:hypothetical protein